MSTKTRVTFAGEFGACTSCDGRIRPARPTQPGHSQAPSGCPLPEGTGGTGGTGGMGGEGGMALHGPHILRDVTMTDSLSWRHQLKPAVETSDLLSSILIH